MTPAIRIERVAAPASVDDPGEALAAIEAIDEANDTALWGYNDAGLTARALAGSLALQRYAAVEVLVALIDGEPGVAGYAHVVMPKTGQRHLAESTMIVSPDKRGRGVGTALLDAAHRTLLRHGRTTHVTWSQYAPEPDADDPDAMTPATNFGRISRSDAATRFALRHGFSLDQVERHSVLELPLEHGRLAALARDAAARAGSEYRLHQWVGATPPALRDGIATLTQRMSTDLPKGEIDLGESDWDADKVAYDAILAEATGRVQLYTAVEHIPSGQIAGYTNLSRTSGRPLAALQDNTIVDPSHRGRRLGMLIKARNLLRLAELWPETRRLHTWNAEENSFMLAINVALGFAPIGTDAMWVRVDDSATGGGHLAGNDETHPEPPAPKAPISD